MNAKGKILIIDDNEDVLFALNLLLDPYVEKIAEFNLQMQQNSD